MAQPQYRGLTTEAPVTSAAPWIEAERPKPLLRDVNPDLGGATDRPTVSLRFADWDVVGGCCGVADHWEADGSYWDGANFCGARPE